MNDKHEETNYCAIDDNRKLKGTKDCVLISAKSGSKRSLINLLLFITRKYAFICLKRRTIAWSYIPKRQKAIICAYIRFSLLRFTVTSGRPNFVTGFVDMKNLRCSWRKLLLTYLEFQVRVRNIMMADTQTDYLNDYCTNCEKATRNLSGEWLCYDLLFIPHGNFKLTLYKLNA